jgi:hypothetical protein
MNKYFRCEDLGWLRADTGACAHREEVLNTQNNVVENVFSFCEGILVRVTFKRLFMLMQFFICSAVIYLLSGGAEWGEIFSISVWEVDGARWIHVLRI